MRGEGAGFEAIKILILLNFFSGIILEFTLTAINY